MTNQSVNINSSAYVPRTTNSGKQTNLMTLTRFVRFSAAKHNNCVLQQTADVEYVVSDDGVKRFIDPKWGIRSSNQLGQFIKGVDRYELVTSNDDFFANMSEFYRQLYRIDVLKPQRKTSSRWFNITCADEETADIIRAAANGFISVGINTTVAMYARKRTPDETFLIYIGEVNNVKFSKKVPGSPVIIQLPKWDDMAGGVQRYTHQLMGKQKVIIPLMDLRAFFDRGQRDMLDVDDKQVVTGRTVQLAHGKLPDNGTITGFFGIIDF